MLGLTLALVVHYCLIADTDANYAPAYTPILFSECIPVIHNRTYEAKDPQSYIYCNTDGIFVQKQCSNSKVYSPAAGRCVDQRFQSVFSRLRIQNIQEDALGCPTNQVAHVDVATNQPSSCTPSSTGTGSGCPLGFGCWFSSSQQMNLCCGLDAGCPANSAGFINTQSGTAQSCLTTSTTPCADGFHCVSSTNTALGTVCCSKTDTDPVNTCPNGSPAVMSGNVMLQCATSVNCPAGYTCTQISDKKGCCIQGTDGSTPDIVCAQPINAGSTCSAGSILPSTRFHFDPVTKQCASFQYLGCNGNQNNFHTLDECHSFCGPTVCPAGSPLISQGTTGTFAQCSNGVASCPIYYTCTPVDRVSMCCPDKDRACALPMDQGIPCTDAPASTRQRWYFSPSTQTCTQFTFRGCQGNDNRFTSQAKCQQICGGSSTSTKGNCPNGVTPASPQDCLINQIPSTCQSGYSCQYSSTSVPICCVTSGLTQAQCPTTFVPEIDTVTGEPKVCIPGYSNTRCSSTFSCTPSTVNTVYTCCRKPGGTVERGTDECPNGELMEYTEALAPKFCVPNFANTCTAGYVCLLSTQVNHVCCLGDPVCPSGMQRYNLPNTQRQPLTCTPTGAGNECPTSYFCVTSSIPRLSICCQPDPQNTQSQCPNDAEPYLTPLRNEVMPCYGSECPNGFTCVPSQLNSATTICCSTDRRVHAACEGGSMPLVDAQGGE